MAERDPAPSVRNMEGQNVELNEGLSAQSEDSSVDRSSSDGSVSPFAKITEEKDSETLSCSISTNASEIEEKETSKSDRSDSTIVQIVEEKEAADFSCSLATNAPKIDEKETAEVSCLLAINAPKIDEKNAAVARCSYTTNAFKNEEMGSSNSTSVSEVSGTDKSDVNNSSETLRVYEAVERQKKETGSAMKEIKAIKDVCQTVILRGRNAQISALETLKQFEQLIKEANDCDLKLQSQHVSQIFHDAGSSAFPESHSVRVEKAYVEEAYNTIANKMDDLEKHVNQFGVVGIDEKLNALERAINHANDSVVATRSILRSTHTEIKVLRGYR